MMQGLLDRAHQGMERRWEGRGGQTQGVLMLREEASEAEMAVACCVLGMMAEVVGLRPGLRLMSSTPVSFDVPISLPLVYCGGLPAPPSERRLNGLYENGIWPRPFGSGAGTGWTCCGEA